MMSGDVSRTGIKGGSLGLRDQSCSRSKSHECPLHGVHAPASVSFQSHQGWLGNADHLCEGSLSRTVARSEQCDALSNLISSREVPSFQNQSERRKRLLPRANITPPAFHQPNRGN